MAAVVDISRVSFKVTTPAAVAIARVQIATNGVAPKVALARVQIATSGEVATLFFYRNFGDALVPVQLMQVTEDGLVAISSLGPRINGLGYGSLGHAPLGD